MKFELTPNNRGQTNEVLLEDMRRVARKLGKDSLTRDEYDKIGRFSCSTIERRFGGWIKALGLAGLRVEIANFVSKEEILADLRRVAVQLNKNVITREEYAQFGKHIRRTIRLRCGSWTAALKEAGLTVSSNYRERTPDEELWQNMESVWRALGRQPSMGEMMPPLSIIGPDTYRRRFGSWRKALEAFVQFVNNGEPQQPPANDQNGQPDPQKEQNAPTETFRQRRTPRTVSWRLRFLVMRRDGFRCRYCGVSPAITPGVILVVDHIHAWANGSETVFENLQTLCEQCNGGKSDLPLEDGNR
jgi:hypothetical protein